MADARDAAAELLSSVTGAVVNPSTVEIRLDGRLGHQVASARAANDYAIQVREAAAQESRRVVRRLLAMPGVTQAEVAALLGLSPQRVSQLVAPRKKATAPGPGGVRGPSVAGVAS